MPLVKSYLRIFKQLGETFGLDKNISLESVSQMRDVILVKSVEVDVESVRAALRVVLELALDSYDAMRNQEGKAIEDDFHKRLQLIEAYLNDIKERAPNASNGY